MERVDGFAVFAQYLRDLLEIATTKLSNAAPN
jgi:hypothetical protein